MTVLEAKDINPYRIGNGVIHPGPQGTKGQSLTPSSPHVLTPVLALHCSRALADLLTMEPS